MSYTTYFTLEKPLLGSYLGSWNVPVNANMDVIDAALFAIRTSNKEKLQGQIVEEGTTWYDTASHRFYIKKNTDLKQLVTTDEFTLSVSQQNELKGGSSTISNLHSHPGYSTQFFRVKDPTLASTDSEITNQPNFAIPFTLFSDNKTETDDYARQIRKDLDVEIAKLQGISEDGVNIGVLAISASGDIETTKAIKARAGTTASVITIGGGTSAAELEFITSKNIPINFKTDETGTLELQVQGSNVMTTTNGGKNSLFDADKVDGCNVDDTASAATNILWTSDKIDKTKFTHPNSHPATIIDEDATHRFVTDEEKINWNNKISSIPVATEIVSGTVKIGDGIDLNQGSISVLKASKSDFGIMRVGSGLEVAGGVVSSQGIFLRSLVVADGTLIGGQGTGNDIFAGTTMDASRCVIIVTPIMDGTVKGAGFGGGTNNASLTEYGWNYSATPEGSGWRITAYTNVQTGWANGGSQGTVKWFTTAQVTIIGTY